MAVVEALSRRIAASGGAALLIDYGANKPYTNSLTGTRVNELGLNLIEFVAGCWLCVGMCVSAGGEHWLRVRLKKSVAGWQQPGQF